MISYNYDENKPQGAVMATIAYNLGFDAYRGWSYSDDIAVPENPFTESGDEVRAVDWAAGWSAAEAEEAEYMIYLETTYMDEGDY